MSGICEFCGITDDEVDGDRIAWVDFQRNCCSKSACVRARNEKIRRQRAQRPQRRTPADIHALKIQEAKAKRARYRAAAKARGLLKERGDR
jgi:hypothetical protein